MDAVRDGGRVAKMLDKRPRVPIVYRFGGQHAAIPPSDVEQIASACPAARVHVYPSAMHGFNCEDRPSFSASGSAARVRPLAVISSRASGLGLGFL